MVDETSEIPVIRQRLLDTGLVYATEGCGYVDFTVSYVAECDSLHAVSLGPGRVAPLRSVRLAAVASALDGSITLLASSEPSKVPFYVAAVLLVVWAILVALAGLRSPDFPGSRGLGRGVIGISVVLFAAALTTSVITAAKPAKAHESARTKGGAAPSAGGASTTPTPAKGGAGPTGTVSLAADPSGQLKYDSTALTAKAGKVTIDFTNTSPVAHNVTITAGGKNVAATKTFAKGKASVSTTLKPGTYTFLCSVDGHAQAGMTGTLTVK